MNSTLKKFILSRRPSSDHDQLIGELLGERQPVRICLRLSLEDRGLARLSACRSLLEEALLLDRIQDRHMEQQARYIIGLDRFCTRNGVLAISPLLVRKIESSTRAILEAA